jgi:hypothetical protein
LGDAESYTNFGRTDPRKTGLPNYVIEIRRAALGIKDARDGYPKTSKQIPVGRISRAWMIRPFGQRLLAYPQAVHRPSRIKRDPEHRRLTHRARRIRKTLARKHTAKGHENIHYKLLRPVDCIAPHDIDLRSGSSSLRKTEKLAAAFRKKGFNPNAPALVGYPLKNKIQLLDGTHRLEAARRSGILLPVIVKTRKAMKTAYSAAPRGKSAVWKAFGHNTVSVKNLQLEVSKKKMSRRPTRDASTYKAPRSDYYEVSYTRSPDPTIHRQRRFEQRVLAELYFHKLVKEVWRMKRLTAQSRPIVWLEYYSHEGVDPVVLGRG